VQVGVRFSSAVAGTISSVQFYKGAGNTGTHTVNIWSVNGVQLATATATAETASGWQTVALATPLAITAGTEYRATYYLPTGHYAVDINGLSAPVTNGSLTALGSAYVYGTSAPINNAAHNYWVDVSFSPSP
jgi:hypothetical protein